MTNLSNDILLFMYKIVSLLLFCGGFVYVVNVPSVDAASTTSAVLATSTIATSTSVTIAPVLQTPEVVEKRVREYFADIPLMIDIARCESSFRQFTDAGSVMRGGVGGEMVGVFQFYEKVHAKAALTAGFDLATVEGNIAYARSIYEQSGTTPWSSCVPTVISAPADANRELRIKLLTKVVALLTELLRMKLAEQAGV